jgi:hypothetical protein
MSDARPLIIDSKRLLDMLDKKIAEVGTEKRLAGKKPTGPDGPMNAGCRILKISHNTLWRIREGQRTIGDGLARKVGYRKIVAYRRIDA